MSAEKSIAVSQPIYVDTEHIDEYTDLPDPHDFLEFKDHSQPALCIKPALHTVSNSAMTQGIVEEEAAYYLPVQIGIMGFWRLSSSNNLSEYLADIPEAEEIEDALHRGYQYFSFNGRFLSSHLQHGDRQFLEHNTWLGLAMSNSRYSQTTLVEGNSLNTINYSKTDGAEIARENRFIDQYDRLHMQGYRNGVYCTRVYERIGEIQELPVEMLLPGEWKKISTMNFEHFFQVNQYSPEEKAVWARGNVVFFLNAMHFTTYHKLDGQHVHYYSTPLDAVTDADADADNGVTEKMTSVHGRTVHTECFEKGGSGRLLHTTYHSVRGGTLYVTREQNGECFTSTISQLVPFEDYLCGSGALSTTISYTSTYLCDQIQLNQCCMYHDLCYSSCVLPQMECDNQFCECLATIISNPFCETIVFPTHCNFARLFGNLFICPMMG
ncbi:unnamed protein product [Caenorhabditis sp. 36 PRJEB53466]|nr:unnamed protein product [Caenorhabditis sp. 36 PRJEB53466]